MIYLHPFQKILTGKSIELYSDGLYEDKIHIDTDYYIRVDMKQLTMSDILIYAQHKIDRARHKLNKVIKELLVYDSQDSIVKVFKKHQRMSKRRKKERKDSLLEWSETIYDLNFEYRYIALAQERLKQIDARFPDKITNNWLVNSVRDLIKIHNFEIKDTSWDLSLEQMCKEWLNDLDNKSHIVDLCDIYDIVSDITDAFEHFKPYNVSYGSVQIDMGWVCFWLCDEDTYRKLSVKKQQKLPIQWYLIEFDVSSVDNMRYMIYLYIPDYIQNLQKDPKYVLSLEEEELRHTLSYKAIGDLIQQLGLESISFHTSMVTYNNNLRN